MPYAPSSALSVRHQAVRDLLRQRSLDALVVTSLPNILYLTNFGGSTAIVVVTLERLFFLTDFRYVTTIAEMCGTPHECPGLELVTVGGSYEGRLVELLASGPFRRVGFEAAHLSVARYDWIQKRVANGPSAPELVRTEALVEAARVRKDAYEIGLLREGARRLSRVAEATVKEVRRGRTERDVAFAIEQLLREAGFEKPAFDTIVAGGPNGALPHATPGERKLTEGDLVVLDFGGVYDSYCVDLTRTVSVGRASARARDVYGAVLQAHDLAVRAVSPGASRFAIDAAARDWLAQAGMAEAFGHGTGHGLGIEVHEDPRIGRRRPDMDVVDETVGAGMVFTIEPGAYFPGWGGVRIEDDVLVTETGVEVLTDATTELLEL
jgi:Xaa-Pro aminopeptidase